ncbi:tRNA lysidine(34) synthetase TilS [Gemella haemolysans]|uniref:tRNA lysidine(34) synthetase TilS n=1 Tax=Gemella haemolysans TaxID=1379 RepID=UPI00195BF97E|nr:tRNA lysidine(34) synthetase TilS [Gemella haemolysans]VTX77126.1 tRNA(Ile)-lysidine synthase [Gemella haemolysans]
MDINILWQKTDKIALGLSGGVDSIALFHLLVTNYKESYKELVVFHINHGLREQSYEEAEFVENFVKNYNVKFYKKELNMNGLVRDSHTSEEMLARKLRYEAFEEMSSLEGGVKLVTAHHKNDQVENILMRLLSGRSMDYNLMIEEQTTIGNLEVYRPLLNILKIDLEQYADKNNLKYYVDSTNFDTDYTRNNIRHNIVPLLNDVNAASFDNLINFSSYYQNINTELKNKVLEAKNDYVISEEEGKVELDKEKLLKNTKEEVYFLLRDILANNFCIFDVKQIALFTIIDDLKNRNNNKSYDLKNNLKIISEYNSIYIHKIEKKCYNDKIELIIDEVDINKVYTFHQSNFLITTMNNSSEVGFNREDLPLVVTTKRDGDRIQRGKVSKKLSRLFIDEKIPKELRDKLPVIRNKDGVLGVLGINTKVNKNKKYDYYINMKG